MVYGIEGNPGAALETIAPFRKNVIPNSADDSVFELISLYGRTMRTPFAIMQPELAAFNAQAISNKDYNLVHTSAWVIAYGHFRAGHLSIGWRRLGQLLNEAQAAGNVNIIRQTILLRAEIQLAICGLIDPQSEAPASEPELPRDRPTLADLAVYLWVRLTGKRRADADFERVIKFDPLKYGSTYARACIGMGLIAKSRGDIQKAHAHLKVGLENAQAEALEQLIQRATRALEQMPQLAAPTELDRPQ